MNKPLLISIGVVVALGVMGSVLSPANVVNILGFCGVVAVNMLNLLKASEAITRAEQGQQETVKQLVKIEETGEKVHTLVNSNMGVQLKLNAVLSSRIAKLTNDPGDLKASELAESLLREHEAKQLVVDTAEKGKS